MCVSVGQDNRLFGFLEIRDFNCFNFNNNIVMLYKFTSIFVDIDWGIGFKSVPDLK